MLSWSIGKEKVVDKKTGGQAFPGIHPSKDCKYIEEGMTLRDYFAGMAMQGCMASRVNTDNYMLSDDMAELAYEVADAMIAEREREGRERCR